MRNYGFWDLSTISAQSPLRSVFHLHSLNLTNAAMICFFTRRLPPRVGDHKIGNIKKRCPTAQLLIAEKLAQTVAKAEHWQSERFTNEVSRLQMSRHIYTERVSTALPPQGQLLASWKELPTLALATRAEVKLQLHQERVLLSWTRHDCDWGSREDARVCCAGFCVLPWETNSLPLTVWLSQSWSGYLN